jgi:hypothetical protein
MGVRSIGSEPSALVDQNPSDLMLIGPNQNISLINQINNGSNIGPNNPIVSLKESALKPLQLDLSKIIKKVYKMKFI